MPQSAFSSSGLSHRNLMCSFMALAIGGTSCRFDSACRTPRKHAFNLASWPWANLSA